MKARIYLRVAKNEGGRSAYMVEANAKPNNAPLVKAQGYNQADLVLPTIAFAVDFNIPDEMFAQAEKVVGEINLTRKEGVIAAEIDVPGKVEKVQAKKGKK